MGPPQMLSKSSSPVAKVTRSGLDSDWLDVAYDAYGS